MGAPVLAPDWPPVGLVAELLLLPLDVDDADVAVTAVMLTMLLLVGVGGFGAILMC